MKFMFYPIVIMVHVHNILVIFILYNTKC